MENLEYQAPAIEQEMSSEDVTREVHYAGGITFTD